MCAIYIYKSLCVCSRAFPSTCTLTFFAVLSLIVFFFKYVPAYLLFFQRAHAGAGKEDGKTCKRVAIRTTIRKDDCRSNAPVGKGEMQADFKPLHVPCQRVFPPRRSRSTLAMGNARPPPYSTLTSTATRASASAAARTDCRPAP